MIYTDVYINEDTHGWCLAIEAGDRIESGVISSGGIIVTITHEKSGLESLTEAVNNYAEINCI